jgi:hypothetical protein
MNAMEIGRKAREIYEQSIKPLVEPEHMGKFLVLDIDSGGYEIGEDQVAVSRSAKQKYPNGIRVGLRIGYPTVGTAGRHIPARRTPSTRANSQ